MWISAFDLWSVTHFCLLVKKCGVCSRMTLSAIAAPLIRQFLTIWMFLFFEMTFFSCSAINPILWTDVIKISMINKWHVWISLFKNIYLFLCTLFQFLIARLARSDPRNHFSVPKIISSCHLLNFSVFHHVFISSLDMFKNCINSYHIDSEQV